MFKCLFTKHDYRFVENLYGDIAVKYSARSLFQCVKCKKEIVTDELLTDLQLRKSGRTGEISDGYHTFDQLYEHRCYLFAALAKAMPNQAFKRRTDDPEWFIGCIVLDSGQITYHLPISMWDIFHGKEGIPKWDGHTSDDVINRLSKTLKTTNKRSSAERMREDMSPPPEGSYGEWLDKYHGVKADG